MIKLFVINFLLTTFFMCQFTSSEKSGVPTEVVYGWKTIEFVYNSSHHRQDLINQKKFIPNNVGIATAKIQNNRMFLSVPRFFPGTPVALAEVPYNFFEISSFQKFHPNGPPLKPFPSWEMQEIGNCSAFQMVQSMETDQFSRLWVMDTGKVNVLAKTVTGCPGKLIIFDLLNKDKIVQYHEFPDLVLPFKSGVLIEIVVGCVTRENCWAYMADIVSESVIVYSLQKNKSWTVKHPSMKPEPGNYSVFGKPFTWKIGVDGLALAPLSQNFDTLYYTPLTGFNLYGVSTIILQKLGDQVTPKKMTFNLPDTAIKKVGQRSSLCDGLAMDSNGRLFVGANELNSLFWWDFEKGGKFKEEFLNRDDDNLNWSDAITFDQRGHLLTTATKFNEVPNINRSLVSYKIVRIFVGTRQNFYLPCKSNGGSCND